MSKIDAKIISTAVATFLISVGLPSPASAASLMYDILFNVAEVHYEPRVGYPTWLKNPPTGRFEFNDSTNKVESFAINLGFPTPNFADGVNAMLAAAPSCDISCLVQGINGGSWRYESGSRFVHYGSIDLAFLGGGLNGTVTKDVYDGGPLYAVGYSGTYRVSGPVPEPLTWTMMIVGFLAIGVQMRRGVHLGQRSGLLPALD